MDAFAKFANLFWKEMVERLPPPTASVPSSLACLTQLVLPDTVAWMTACAIDLLLAMTLDFLAETCMSIASSNTWTAKSIASARTLITT